MQDNPTITVAIPVCDGEARLREAIDSVLSQGYSNLELVIVDDASTDGSLAIARGAAARDPRVKVVAHPENRQLLEARRTAIESASGDYLMFLDADDMLEQGLCEACVEELGRREADILHFSAIPIYSQDVPAEVEQGDTAYFRPEEGAAFGEDIVHRIYRDRKGPWCVWGKLYNVELLRTAFGAIPARRLFFGEDAFTFFAVASQAHSYRALPELRGYIHRIEEGVSGHIRVEQGSLDGLRALCSKREAIQAVSAAISGQDAWDAYREDFDRLRRQFADDSVGYVVTRVPEADLQAAFDELMEYWNPADTLETLLRRGEEDSSRYLSLMRDSKLASVVDEGRTGVAVLIDEDDSDAKALLDMSSRLEPQGELAVVMNEGASRLYAGESRLLTVTSPDLYQYRLRGLVALIEERAIGVVCLPGAKGYPYDWDAVVANLLGCIVVRSHEVAGGKAPEVLEGSAQPAARLLRDVLSARA